MTKPRPGAHYHHWTAQEDELVLEQSGLDRDLARQLGVTMGALQTRHHLLRRVLGPDAPPGRVQDPCVSHVGTVKDCAVCGTQFKAKPSGRKTCSEECARVLLASARRDKVVVWSEEAKRRRKERGYTSNLRLGAPAAVLSPLAGPFETNVLAKEWWIINLESGQRWPAVHNLAKWCRDHADLYAPDDWHLAYAGLRQVQAWLLGKSKVKHTRWKAWSLYHEARILND